MQPIPATTSGHRSELRERWRRFRAVPLGWLATLTVIIVAVSLPVLTIAWLALKPSDGALPQLLQTVAFGAVRDTALLMIGTGLLTLIIGTSTAWLVTMYRFPGRALLDRLLVLPLAMPAYILAYAYVEMLDYAGPLQRGLRALVGWQSARDYAMPDVRSLGGAILVLSSALYPYVYLSARASFVQQSVCVLEVARTLGQTSIGAFARIALPLARPALVAGLALVLMECLNEFGALQYLGVTTLSVAIYTTWLQRGSLIGAAQIAAFALVVVAALLVLERHARRGASYHHTTNRLRALPFQHLSGAWAVGAVLACVLPVLFGFVLPFLQLLSHAQRHLSDALASGFWKALFNSLLLSGLAAIAAVFIGLVLAYARRIVKGPVTEAATTIASMGYAIPGTVLAVGLMIPLSGIDVRIDAAVRALTGWSSGPLLSGSMFALVLAYVIRFLAISYGALDTGLSRLSPNLDAAARTLGSSAKSALRRVHLPLIWPAIGTAALLVFVDAMKELPATLLLRPFNFETLATSVYALAALEQFETASLGALAIVIAGLVPVLLLHRTVAGGRAGGKT